MRRALVVLAAVLALVVWRYAPPAPRGAATPADEFSAARARGALGRVLGDGRPHPTGSAANEAVRVRLAAELARMGLRPVVEESLACAAGGRCATVKNLVARLPGREPAQPAVLLACHYDSVAAGAGAADDGAGIATTLEVARALLAGQPLLRDVLLLIDDGEEQGLLGAEAFVRDTERLKRIGAVVNVEARGTTGASLLFELSPGNARLVRAASRTLPRPATNSIYYTIYQRLPNDTDLTVFKRVGLAGVNFAFVGGPLRYHTPRDDLDHLDAGSLQHHGDHALAMVRALGSEGGSWQAAGDEVFFDVLTLLVVRWPQPWTLPLALLGAALVVAALVLGKRRAQAGAEEVGGGVGWSGLAVLATLLLAPALAWVLAALLRAIGALPYDWVAYAWPLRLAFWSLALGTVAAVAWALGSRLRPAGAWAATWLSWALLAVAAAALAPGVSYPLVVPVLLAGVAGLAARGRVGSVWAWLPPLVAAAVLLFPTAWLLHDGMGAPALPAVAAVVGLVLTGALPAFAGAGRRRLQLLAAAAVTALLVGAVASRALPRFTADDPQPLSLVLHHDGDTGTSQWVAGASDVPLPPELGAAAAFASAKPYPWAAPLSGWVAPAGAVVSPSPPDLVVDSILRGGTGILVRARLLSSRGAAIAGVFVPGDRLLGARLAGQEVPLRELAERDDWQSIETVTLPAGGVDLELKLDRPDPLTLYVYDVEPGLAGVGDELLRRRPARAVPIGRGDRILVSRAVQLSPPR